MSYWFCTDKVLCMPQGANLESEDKPGSEYWLKDLDLSKRDLTDNGKCVVVATIV